MYANAINKHTLKCRMSLCKYVDKEIDNGAKIQLFTTKYLQGMKISHRAWKGLCGGSVE